MTKALPRFGNQDQIQRPLFPEEAIAFLRRLAGHPQPYVMLSGGSYEPTRKEADWIAWRLRTHLARYDQAQRSMPQAVAGDVLVRSFLNVSYVHGENAQESARYLTAKTLVYALARTQDEALRDQWLNYCLDNRQMLPDEALVAFLPMYPPSKQTALLSKALQRDIPDLTLVLFDHRDRFTSSQSNWLIVKNAIGAVALPQSSRKATDRIAGIEAFYRALVTPLVFKNPFIVDKSEILAQLTAYCTDKHLANSIRQELLYFKHAGKQRRQVDNPWKALIHRVVEDHPEQITAIPQSLPAISNPALRRKMRSAVEDLPASGAKEKLLLALPPENRLPLPPTWTDETLADFEKALERADIEVN